MIIDFLVDFAVGNTMGADGTKLGIDVRGGVYILKCQASIFDLWDTCHH